MVRGALDCNARAGSELAGLRSSGFCRVELICAKTILPRTGNEKKKNRTTIFSPTRTTTSSREESPVASRVNQVRKCPVAKELNAQSPVANTLIPTAETIQTNYLDLTGSITTQEKDRRTKFIRTKNTILISTMQKLSSPQKHKRSQEYNYGKNDLH